jgi:hypothetical protein
MVYGIVILTLSVIFLIIEHCCGRDIGGQLFCAAAFGIYFMFSWIIVGFVLLAVSSHCILKGEWDAVFMLTDIILWTAIVIMNCISCYVE